MEPAQNIIRSVIAVNRFIRYAKIELAKFLGLNPTEYELLYTLFACQNNMSIKELSKEMFLCSQAITKITKNLAKLGYIETQKSFSDKRVTFVSLTKLGTMVMQRGEAVHGQMIQTAIQHIEKEDIKTTEFVLQQIKRNITEATEDFTKLLIDFESENFPRHS